MADAIRVTGLNEARHALNAMKGAERSLEVRAGLVAAATLVAGDAKGRVRSRSGAAAGTIRPLVSGAHVAVAGGDGLRYYGWLEFGTRSPRHGNPRRRGPWSGSGKGPPRGRFIYPALDAKKAESAEAVAVGLDKLIRKAGWH